MCFPLQWYPMALRLQLGQWLGADEYRAPPMAKIAADTTTELPCPEDLLNWRDAQTIAGVDVRHSPGCIVDNPNAVAAFVRGTNNVSQQILMASGLTPDAVEKGRDLDGDGDPDEIHIRLEVVELNGGSPESDLPTTQYAIAPGISPGFWVFAPKMFGMATENFESSKARSMLRLPSPAIRVEQGDIVKITLENSHYMPHTIHFHGVDHPFVDEDGEGNDGVPVTSEKPVLPGSSRTYNMQPRQSGTMFYHCHVQPHVHIMMGLQGLFVVEENRPNNWLQTLNVGAGHVRVPSVAVTEKFDREYDLQYLDIDIDLNNRIQKSNDPRLITRDMHRRYDITDAKSDFFTLNGRSFPYTFRESLVVTKPDEHIKLRIVNGGSTGIALHTHGHKVTATHYDGVEAKPAARITRDVVWIASAQRVDLDLETTNDGLHSYGSGIWLLHDHQEKGVTNDGIGPGGNVSAIVYENYLQENGWPKTQGMDFNKFFTAAYYRKEVPVWGDLLNGKFSDVEFDLWMLIRLLGLGLSLGVMVALVINGINKRRP
ncbi:MAG TPA: copper oxidase [Thiotrichaceae bacterium]|nr:copper oxidase [Thiotrichaceae bacterium]HIM08449.1 copper oxidase [Gammaproteobacteria bacterium]